MDGKLLDCGLVPATSNSGTRANLFTFCDNVLINHAINPKLEDKRQNILPYRCLQRKDALQWCHFEHNCNLFLKL